MDFLKLPEIISYGFNDFVYTVLSLIDILWTPFANVVNAILGVFSAFIDILLTLTAWTNITFSYFIVSLLFIYLFAGFVQIVKWIKQLVTRWF